MNTLATWAFWLSIAAAAYTVVGYGLCLMVLSRLLPRRPAPPPAEPLEVDFLIAAYNEAPHIVAKIENCLNQDNPTGHPLRVMVVSDGSDDGTAELASSVRDERVTVMKTPGRVGKLAALNMALERLTGDVVVFSDANGLLTQGSLAALTEPFGDPQVGGVCGRIGIDPETAGSIGRAEGFFWRYDQALKAAEDHLGGVVSAQGSIYAVRRHLCAPVPPGVSDDFIMSVRAVAKGYRLAFAPGAQAHEEVTERAADEMARRVRSTEMGWRGLMSVKGLMNPFRTGLYGWQLFSHKFLRRMMPLFLVLLFLSSLVLIGQGWFYTAFAMVQVAGYGVVLAAWFMPPLRRLPLVGKAMFFVMTNIAMVLGIIAYWRGVKSSLWQPVRDKG